MTHLYEKIYEDNNIVTRYQYKTNMLNIWIVQQLKNSVFEKYR